MDRTAGAQFFYDFGCARRMLDEPTAGVSPIVMDELFDHIIKVKRTNVAILMVEQMPSKHLIFLIGDMYWLLVKINIQELVKNY